MIIAAEPQESVTVTVAEKPLAIGQDVADYLT